MWDIHNLFVLFYIYNYIKFYENYFDLKFWFLKLWYL